MAIIRYGDSQALNEVCIIFYLGVYQIGLVQARSCIVDFTFGLLHGFGFAGALADIGLPQQDIPWALAFFNVGVEIGQIAFVLVVLIFIKLLSYKKDWPALVKKVPAYAIGSMAAFWLIERVVRFWE